MRERSERRAPRPERSLERSTGRQSEAIPLGGGHSVQILLTMGEIDCGHISGWRSVATFDYAVTLSPSPEPEGGRILASVAGLQGCQAWGETPEEALANVMNAIEAWKARASESGRAIPCLIRASQAR